MTLQQLFQYFQIQSQPEVLLQNVTGLTLNSQLVQPGSVFFAVRGHSRDGHESIPEAISKGAIAIVCSDTSNIPADYAGVILQILDVRGVISLLAARYYQFPSRNLWTVGVTGTNGKTSITFLCEWLLQSQDVPTAVMGTIDHHLGNKKWATELTTPDPISLQSRLRDFKSAGAQAVLMEVSSHSLDQKRVEGVDFDVAVFSNLTRDHLDYHKTLEAYHAAKQRLFTDLMWKSQKSQTWSIINSDDAFGRRLRVSERSKIWTYGLQDCDFQFSIENFNWTGTHFRLRTPYGEFEVNTPLLGKHNVYNVVAALAVAAAYGLSILKCIESLKNFPGIPGRLQKVPLADRHVFVDYAHSPDALVKVLSILRKIRDELSPESKIWTVFGCGGDRDKGKRPLMAAAVEEFSDQAVVTSDNPRTEDPQKIIEDILKGFKNKKFAVVVDRRQAIAETLKESKPGDVILIAGKGHEDYQIIGHDKIHFSDYEVVLEEGQR